jgi:hypothetical protein
VRLRTPNTFEGPAPAIAIAAAAILLGEVTAARAQQVVTILNQKSGMALTALNRSVVQAPLQAGNMAQWRPRSPGGGSA